MFLNGILKNYLGILLGIWKFANWNMTLLEGDLDALIFIIYLLFRSEGTAEIEYLSLAAAEKAVSMYDGRGRLGLA